MPTHKIKKSEPRPMNIDATEEIIISFTKALVYLVDVTSYTKNHAVKNSPIDSKINARCGYVTGLIGLRYRAPIDSNSSILNGYR